MNKQTAVKRYEKAQEKLNAARRAVDEAWKAVIAEAKKRA